MILFDTSCIVVLMITVLFRYQNTIIYVNELKKNHHDGQVFFSVTHIHKTFTKIAVDINNSAEGGFKILFCGEDRKPFTLFVQIDSQIGRQVDRYFVDATREIISLVITIKSKDSELPNKVSEDFQKDFAQAESLTRVQIGCCYAVDFSS